MQRLIVVILLFCLLASPWVHAQVPLNDDCVNATVINPRDPTPLLGDTTLATFDSARENVCNATTTAPGLWYKFYSYNASVEVTATTCNNGTSFDTLLSVFVGNDCNSLSCVRSNDDGFCIRNEQASTVTFLTQPNQTYWIVAQGFRTSKGFFHLTVSASTFLLVNPVTDLTLGFLKDSSYVNLPVSRLNIQAIEDPALPPPRSMRLTFDDPFRNACENVPPFTVFGDVNSDYLNATIPSGTHVVTATPYNDTNCRGTAGPTVRQSFSLASCSIGMTFFDVANNQRVLLDFFSSALEYLPCSLNIQANIRCGFPINEVQLELRNNATNTLLVSRIERTAPYTVFGKDNNGTLLSGEIPAGKYKIVVTVDGVRMTNYIFVATKECAKNIPPNDACTGAIPLTLNSSAPVQFNGDTTLAVLDFARENTCLSFGSASSGLWYKFTTPPAPFQSKILLTTCNNVTNFETSMILLTGNDCNSLSCVTSNFGAFTCSNPGASEITFLSQPNRTYWVVVNGAALSNGLFQLTVDSNPNVFVLVDSVSDRPNRVLQDFSYDFFPISSLNIQATYDPDLPAPRSVRLTFDNPGGSSVCDNTAPFSVFGDTNGDFFNATISPGNHLVTATSYNESNCQGTAGPTRNQTFFVEGCTFVAYNLYNATGRRFVRSLSTSFPNVLDSIPCATNINVFAGCAFQPREVKLELRNNVSNALLASRVERTDPYYLFGDVNGRMLAGEISPGSYQITAFYDGIKVNSATFSINRACVP